MATINSDPSQVMTEKSQIADSTHDAESSSANVGQVEVMRTRYNFTTLFSLFVACSAAWESIVSSLYQVLAAGGPTVLVWGYIISASAAVCVAASLAEFASVWPSAAGQYHWTVSLSPPWLRRYTGWFAAYFLLVMQILASVGVTYTCAMQIQSMVILTVSSYVAERWHTYLMWIAFNLICAGVNLFIPRAIHYISITGLVVHVLGFFALSITLLKTTKEFNSAKLVFATIEDNTGWHSKGAAFLIGMLPGAYSFVGLDAPAHFSEETAKPHTDVSRAIFWGTITNAMIGFPFILILCFCMGPPAVLLTSPIITINPLAQIIINSTGSIPAAITLCVPVVLVGLTSCIDGFGVCTRIVMAQGRDHALPFGDWIAKIHPRWNTPANAVMALVVIQIAIAAIYVGNITAFYGISSGFVTLQVSSIISPIVLYMLFSRSQTVTWGPWRMNRKVRWGAHVIAASIYIMLFGTMLLPTVQPVTAANMNYACALMGGTIVIATVIWLFWGHKIYDGPRYQLASVAML